MRHKLISASCMVAAIAVIGAAPAYATPNSHGDACGFSGPPNSTNPATMAPGNSATSPGSTHNEPGTVSVNGGKGGAAYNKAGAPSQYDTSCANVTANGTGTPIQFSSSPSTLPTQVANNSKATRAADGVPTHTPKG